MIEIVSFAAGAAIGLVICVIAAEYKEPIRRIYRDIWSQL